MIPKNADGLQDYPVRIQPSNTYKMMVEKERILGNTDGKEAIEQAIYKILNTERGQNLIYSKNYGVQLRDLFGRSREYVISELPTRIKQALIADDRILEVEHFQFEVKGNSVHTSFIVRTIQGEIQTQLEVRV